MNKNILRGAGTFIDNAAVYVTGKSPRKAPLFISWDIAEKCNAKCKFCSRWNIQNTGLSKTERLQVIEQLGHYKVWLLSLCGGEPLMLSELPDLISCAKRKGMIINVSSNGLLLKRRASQLLAAGLDSITLSLDSDRASEHDALRGVPGLFAQVKRGIKVLLSSNVRPRIQVRCIVHEKNINRIESIVTYWRRYADEVLLQPIRYSPDIGFAPPKEYLSVNRMQIASYLSAIRRLRMANSYNLAIPSFLKGNSFSCNRCLSGFFFLEIDSEGLVWNCSEHRKKLGSIFSDNLLSILKNTQFPVRGVGCCDNSAMLNYYLPLYSCRKLLRPGSFL